MIKDWKYVAMLAVAVVGAIAPIWLWRADLSSKVFEVEILSTFSVDGGATSLVKGLQVTLDGKKLDRPYITLLKVKNIGAKPIPSGDWESPLKLSISSKVDIVHARLSLTSEQTLMPSIDFSDAEILIRPILLNPGDYFEVQVLTTGGQPEFSAGARIAGIPAIHIRERELQPKYSPLGATIRLVFGWLSAVLVSLIIFSVNPRRRLPITASVIALVFVVASGGILSNLWQTLTGLRLSGTSYYLAYGAAWIAALVAAWLVIVSTKPSTKQGT